MSDYFDFNYIFHNHFLCMDKEELFGKWKNFLIYMELLVD